MSQQQQQCKQPCQPPPVVCPPNPAHLPSAQNPAHLQSALSPAHLQSALSPAHLLSASRSALLCHLPNNAKRSAHPSASNKTRSMLFHYELQDHCLISLCHVPICNPRCDLYPMSN
uniref:Uncharacterized protein n=1 Tax=Ovis aries TaxID=9940 RepID=A0AC11AKD2_SHEEP